MAPVSRAQSSPGYAQASQTPFAIGPGGGSGFGDLLSRQFALREQMQQQQLAQMQQDMRFQKQAFTDQRNRDAEQRAVKGGVHRTSPQDQAKSDAYAKEMQFANAMNNSLGFRNPIPGNRQASMGMVHALGVPAAHQGLMQSGQILGQLGSQAIGAGAQMDSNQMQADAQRYGADRRAQTQLQLEGMELQPLPQTGGRSGSLFKSFEDGGRVPKTDTYKLHEGEVVVPRKAADVMFPYAGGGPKKSSGKAKKSYAKGTIELPEGMTKKEAQTFIQRIQQFITEPAGPGAISPILDPTVNWKAGYPGAPMNPQPHKFKSPTRESGFTEGVAGPSLEDLPGMLPQPYIPRDIADPATVPGLVDGQYPPGSGTPEAQPVEASPPPLEYPSVQPPASGGEMWLGADYDPANPKVSEKFGGAITGPRFGGASLGQVSRQDDLVDMKRKEGEVVIAKRSAQVAEQRGDKLERYLNEQSSPNPELVSMIKENDRAAQRWRKRAAELQGEADKTKSQMIGQAIAQLESDTKLDVASIEADTAAGKATADKYSKLQEGLKTAASYLKGQDPNDYALGSYQQAFVQAFVPFLDRLGFLGDTREDRAAAIAQTALLLANAGNEQELAAAQAQYAVLLEAASGI